ncbi:hypothetical protein D3C87_1580710 [compost metagenome]
MRTSFGPRHPTVVRHSPNPEYTSNSVTGEGALMLWSKATDASLTPEAGPFFSAAAMPPDPSDGNSVSNSRAFLRLDTPSLRLASRI